MNMESYWTSFSLKISLKVITYKGKLTRRRVKRKKEETDRQTRWLLHFFSLLDGLSEEYLQN